MSPTRSNPKADNRPGALVFAGEGSGREGTRSLADAYYKAFGPHVGLAYSLNDKTVIRAAYSRSFGAITTVTGSTHFLGFVQIFSPSSLDDGITPRWNYRDGFPSYPIPPFIDPSFGNGNNVPWWQGNEATRPPENNTWTVSIQRQLTSSLLVEASYNGLAGSHLQAGLLNYNQVDPRYLRQYGRDLLNSNINSSAAVAAGIQKPFSSFNGSVAQALRPFPQYLQIDTASGGGDHSGHSTYHAGIIRLEKRYAGSLTFQTSYVLSKLLTDADSYWPGARALNHYNRKLDKSIGQFDATHNFKFGLVYDLPFGRGKKWLINSATNVIAGGWRVSGIAYYSTGLPVDLQTSVGLPLFNGRNAATITSYEGWRGAKAKDKFNPQTDRFFQPASFFGPQPNNGFGNATRYNPKLREFPNYNENVSLAKTFSMTEKLRLDFRWEVFNIFNRVRFGTGPRNLQDPNFGRLTSNADIYNDPRRMQLGLKLYW